LKHNRSIFILGPSEWLKNYRPTIPRWVFSQTLESDVKLKATPLGIRRALAFYLRNNGLNPIVMEDHEPFKLARIIIEN